MPHAWNSAVTAAEDFWMAFAFINFSFSRPHEKQKLGQTQICR